MNTDESDPVLERVRVATDVGYHLAEGPTWDPARREIFWVDIMAGTVMRGAFDAEGAIRIGEVIAFPDTAGAVAVSSAGELAVAGTHRLYYRDVAGRIRPGRQIVTGSGRRLNDMTPDPAGRLLVGTKGVPGEELLLQIDRDETVRTLDDDLTLSNGLAFTRDGRTLYSVDTLSGRIFVRDYDPDSGESGPRNLFVQIDDGYPDGLTLDAEGNLWVAVWGEGCVLQVSARGEIVGRVSVPAPHASCPVFAGPDLDLLVITTAREDLTAEQVAQFPNSGHLFTARPGIHGLPPFAWAGIGPHTHPEGTS